jgi:hypothetical protein
MNEKPNRDRKENVYTNVIGFELTYNTHGEYSTSQEQITGRRLKACPFILK